MRLRFMMLALAVLTACGKKNPETVPTPTGGTTTKQPGTGTPGTTTGGGATTNPTNAGATEAAITADLTRAMQEAIYFDLDQETVRADGQAVLDRKAAIMLANSALRIKISGHADERGSDEYNLVLGNKRATSAKRYLEAKGIDGSRIETVSFGEERPVDSASNEAAWAKNRRDEFELIAGAARLVKSQ